LKFLFSLLFLALSATSCFLQAPANDNCLNATELCANQTVNSTNLQATSSACHGCQDGSSLSGNFCYEINNTVWFTFTTNSVGGQIIASINLLSCTSDTSLTANNELQGIIIDATIPCDESTYIAVSNCVSGASNNFTLLANNLAPNSTYYIQIDGAEASGLSAAECGFEITVSGDGIDPIVNAGEDLSVLPGESVQLNGSGDGIISWLPIETLSNPSITNPLANPISTTTYFISSTINSCTYTDDVLVVVLNPLTVMTAFTPNDDGYNDYWEIANISNYPGSKITVFDRWGQIVFNTSGYSSEKRWNGTNKGLRLPSGTYFYIIEITASGSSKIYNGPVTIIR
tara:strand:+ start:2489 stop:3520 length:1032 start_codon:yes stop_codon:yes gene_type:complete